MNTITFEKSKENFDEFVNNYETYKSINMSESDTRSKLIDTVLINVLGWDEADIIREGHENHENQGDRNFHTLTIHQ